MISKKLLCLHRLTAHLQAITPAWDADCPYDLSESVFRGRLVFGDEVPLPYLSILEAPRQFAPNDVGDSKLTQDEDWRILIQGFANDDKVNPLDPAYDLLAWVQKRMARLTATRTNGAQGGLYPNEFRLGDLVSKIAYQLPIVRPGQDDVSDVAYFYMPVLFGMTTNLAEPFVEGD